MTEPWLIIVGSGTYLRVLQAGRRVQLSWLLVWARQAQVRGPFRVAEQQGAAEVFYYLRCAKQHVLCLLRTRATEGVQRGGRSL